MITFPSVDDVVTGGSLHRVHREHGTAGATSVPTPHRLFALSFGEPPPPGHPRCCPPRGARDQIPPGPAPDAPVAKGAWSPRPRRNPAARSSRCRRRKVEALGRGKSGTIVPARARRQRGPVEERRGHDLHTVSARRNRLRHGDGGASPAFGDPHPGAAALRDLFRGGAGRATCPATSAIRTRGPPLVDPDG